MTGDSSHPVRVLVVDDHPALRDGVSAMLAIEPDMQVVGEAQTGAEAIERFAQLQPDVTLMDLQMPGMDGLEAISCIRASAPQARILVLTTYSGDVQALGALKAGAAGYLLKSALRRELVETIRAVHAGRRYLPPDLASDIALHAIDEPLSVREVGVLRRVAEGCANKQIAWDMGLSEETVKGHLKSIFAKLGVNDRTHAVTVAVRRGVMRI